jgi:hypothetical protein
VTGRILSIRRSTGAPRAGKSVGRCIESRLPTGNGSAGKDYYYTLQGLYTVAGMINRHAIPVEAYVYDAYGKVRLFWVGLHGDGDRQNGASHGWRSGRHG